MDDLIDRAVRELLDDGQTTSEIAERLAVSEYVVRSVIRSRGWQYPKRRGFPGSNSAPISEADLRRLYVDERLSLAAVAAELSATPRRVEYALRKLGIQVRGPRVWDELPIEELRSMFVDEQLPTAVIAQRFGTSPGRVHSTLVRHGIAPPGRAARRDEASWQQHLEDLAGFVAEHGRLPSKAKTQPDVERRLAMWLNHQRSAEKVTLLSADRTAALTEKVPGWRGRPRGSTSVR